MTAGAAVAGARGAPRARVLCLRLGRDAGTLLSRAAHGLRHARGLVAGHGSGLAALPFLPPQWLPLAPRVLGRRCATC